MKVTSETWFTTSGWYEAKNGSNGSCNFVFNSGPPVCNGSSVPKHAVKIRGWELLSTESSDLSLNRSI